MARPPARTQRRARSRTGVECFLSVAGRTRATSCDFQVGSRTLRFPPASDPNHREGTARGCGAAFPSATSVNLCQRGRAPTAWPTGMPGRAGPCRGARACTAPTRPSAGGATFPRGTEVRVLDTRALEAGGQCPTDPVAPPWKPPRLPASRRGLVGTLAVAAASRVAGCGAHASGRKQTLPRGLWMEPFPPPPASGDPPSSASLSLGPRHSRVCLCPHRAFSLRPCRPRAVLFVKTPAHGTGPTLLRVTSSELVTSTKTLFPSKAAPGRAGYSDPNLSLRGQPSAHEPLTVRLWAATHQRGHLCAENTATAQTPRVETRVSGINSRPLVQPFLRDTGFSSKTAAGCTRGSPSGRVTAHRVLHGQHRR